MLREFNSSRSLVDVIETTAEPMWVMKRDGACFRNIFTPEARHYPDDVKAKGKNGLYYLGDPETYNSLGFNTTLISATEAPKSLKKDLLDSEMERKNVHRRHVHGRPMDRQPLDTLGREFLNKMADQEVTVQNMSGAALAGLVASGEVPLSPTIFDANIQYGKAKGRGGDGAP